MAKPKSKTNKSDHQFPDGTNYEPPVEVSDPNQLKSAPFWKNLNQLGFMMAVAIMVGVVPGAMILSNSQQPQQQLQQFPVEVAISEEEACTQSRGEWKEFSNACADTCDQYLQEQLCKQDQTPSCDCGPDSCWDGESCTNNPSSSLISNTDDDNSMDEL